MGSPDGPSARVRDHEPFGLRKIIRGTGKALICIGILLFLFVAYQLWGTGFAERRGQKALGASFEKNRLTAPPSVIPLPGGTSPVTAAVTIELGEAIAQIEIPKIDVKKYVIEGVDVEDLKIGPGHYPGTPLPGERGNAAIAGHRTTYGAPFYELNELDLGDPIFVTTAAGRFRYDVMESKVVDENAVEVLDPSSDDRLTLTTCHPRFSAAERLIVVAKLTSPPVDAAPRPAIDPGQPREERPEARQELAGLSGERVSKTPAILWGTFAALIWAAAWVLGRFWRRWPAYAVAAVPFLLVLFVFYENVARLLPANV